MAVAGTLYTEQSARYALGTMWLEPRDMSQVTVCCPYRFLYAITTCERRRPVQHTSTTGTLWRYQLTRAFSPSSPKIPRSFHSRHGHLGTEEQEYQVKPAALISIYFMKYFVRKCHYESLMELPLSQSPCMSHIHPVLSALVALEIR